LPLRGCVVINLTNMTKLTVPISAGNLEEATGQLTEAKIASAEAVELRLDYIKSLNVELAGKIIAEAKKTALPIFVTCRDKNEGGAIDYPIFLRLDCLKCAIKVGADYIDFELENFKVKENQDVILSAISKSKTKLIVSKHNFEGKFETIESIYDEIKKIYSSAIPKIVYTAKHINDCFEAFDLLHSKKDDAIVLCMGEAGVISRVIAKKLGGLVSFASLSEKSATAAGQITIEQMKKLYRWDEIDSKTELYGIIGSPVGHSLSPLIHNGCFEKIEANKVYLPLLVEGGQEEFNKFMENCLARPWLDFRGFSVTIPHKENALNFVKEKGDFVEPLAERIGAVNTIIIDRGAASGERLVKAYNTDYAGALDAITAGMGIKRENLKGMPVAVVGAGGVARALVAGLADCAAKVKIYNRTVDRARKLAEEFNCDSAPLSDLPKLDAKLLINGTSVGMSPNIQPISYQDRFLKHDLTVFDTIYNPVETPLLKKAKEMGAKTISGLDMFVSQAAEQFRLFTGQKADTGLILKTTLGNKI
jgi:3-dehydroquinate dehydratase/shikimate dehydrogenase